MDITEEGREIDLAALQQHRDTGILGQRDDP
jgi:hypothetical protein